MINVTNNPVIKGNVFANRLLITVTGTTTLTVSSGTMQFVNSSQVSYQFASSSLSINASTTGANGIDTGALAANTWYYVFAIYNPSTQTLAGLISTSSSSPTLPSGYTISGLFGVVRTNGSSQLYRSLQNNSKFNYVTGTNPTGQLLVTSGIQGNITTPTWATISVSNFVPPIATHINLISCAEGAGVLMVNPNNTAGAYNSSAATPFHVNDMQASNYYKLNFEMPLESTNIYYAANVAGNLWCNGFTINRW